ncbi:MAG: hypothetical protein JST85_04040 [Acidobacteria bacterium]|nr:hypothetical protein [Acidobacteriota bacterium]
MKPAQKMQPLAALNRLNEIATGYLASQVFFAACKLGLFQQLDQCAATAEELGQKLNIHPEGCRRLLASLAQIGLVEREGERFRNSELAGFLTPQSPVALEPLVMWGDLFYRLWNFLPDALREYGPRWQQAVGASADETFVALYEDPIRLRRFVQTMNAYSIPEGAAIAEQFDFTPYTCLLDVAGGPGGLSQQIGLRHPHLRGIVMDLPPICRIAEEDIEANGLSGRFRAQHADLFAGPYPAGADVITLGWILHDWNDEHCRTILRNCFDALPSGGALLIVESVLNDDLSGTEFGVMMSLHMTVCCEPGARERSEAEYRTLLEEAGFSLVDVRRYGAPRDLIVARKL